ncbi:MAG: stage II sporulation protein M [Fibrobacteria bacterium]|nr:stage II sporulation protein M [Fibrobacteria bacterium]
MILDLNQYIEKERPCWEELQSLIEKKEVQVLSLKEARRLYFLYKRTATALARFKSESHDLSLQQFLESLVSRAYREIYKASKNRVGFNPWRWFFSIFPLTLRKHSLPLLISLATLLSGAVIGGAVLYMDIDARQDLLPGYLQISPAERVQIEESEKGDRLQGNKMTFSSYLMTNNIKVSIFTFSLGITFGFGTILVLFFNGMLLGAVVFDYIAGGQALFLTGWLLPHGIIEIPAIVIAGQAGLVIAHALIGRGSMLPLKDRMKVVSGDVVTLLGGTAVLLVWAGIVEAFLSQYHDPVLPYSYKIAFGLTELVVFGLFLILGGRKLQLLKWKKKKLTL